MMIVKEKEVMVEVRRLSPNVISVCRFNSSNMVQHSVIVIDTTSDYTVIQTCPTTGEKVLRASRATREYAIGYAVSVVLDFGEVGNEDN